jgi:hypothetical protein
LNREGTQVSKPISRSTFISLRGELIMKKKSYILCLVVLVAVLTALPGVSRAAMWVGGEIGGNFTKRTDIQFAPGLGLAQFYVKPSVIGGVTLGYDFVNSGFLAYSWPDWMKYFSFALDLTYNRMDIPAQNRLSRIFNTPGLNFRGYAVAWTFLFMAHYSFLCDDEIPSGRINPYFGIGPAILFSGIDAGSLGIGSSSATNVALVVEPGIRWMALKNVSIDTALRYRYAAPEYGFGSTNIQVSPLHIFTFLVRANYHF